MNHAPEASSQSMPGIADQGAFSRGMSTVGWGLYCASSWTWCIGIFLPIIMLGLFGGGGYWVFAVPNVIGCAAFGYVLTRERSQAMVAAHAPAIRWFSFVTIIFQIFFLSWATERFIIDDAQWPAVIWPVLGAVLTWTACAGAISLRSDLFWRWIAVIAAVAAVILFIMLVGYTGGIRFNPRPEDAPSLLASAPIIILGFLLNPYLDATFHRARQNTPSKHAFAIFGLAFAFMLAFSAASFNAQTLLPYLLPVVFVQWTIQLVFTIGAHLREVRDLPHRRIGATLVCFSAVLIGAGLGIPGLAREEVYLSILGLYALPFPMYMVAAIANGLSRPLPLRSIMAIIVLSGLLSPLGWLGFVENQTLALAPAFIGVLFGGIVIGKIARNSSGPVASTG